MSIKKLLLSAAVVFSAVIGGANAETINLRYVGAVTERAQNDFGISDISGSGVVTFADGLTSVSLSDLTNFSFNLTMDGSGGTDVDSYGLGDIVDPPGFSATLDETGNVTSLTFTTGFGSGGWFYPGQQLSMDLVNGSNTGNFDVGGFSIGTLTADVPEPATLTLMATGLLGMLRIRRKRR
ncbi:MAG: PEP-CTERM sorting domain-containing protein [Rhodopila sp.]|nr:PEP-CTERM sorting domain-containing protein [Rhodopila sp.]